MYNVTVIVFRVACQCMAIVLEMNEEKKLNFIQKYMSLDQHYDYTHQYEVEKQCSHSVAVETLNYGILKCKLMYFCY